MPGNIFKLSQQANPQDLNLDGITFARRAGGIIRVHPSEMARAPNERGVGIHVNAVGRAFGIIFRDARQDLGDRAALFINGSFVKFLLGQILAHHREPQWRIGRVAIGNIIAVDGVGQRAVLFKFSERQQNLFHLVGHACRQKSARTNQRVAAPIQKPRIASNDGLEIIAPHHELSGGEGELRREI